MEHFEDTTEISKNRTSWPYKNLNFDKMRRKGGLFRDGHIFSLKYIPLWNGQSDCVSQSQNTKLKSKCDWLLTHLHLDTVHKTYMPVATDQYGG